MTQELFDVNKMLVTGDLNKNAPGSWIGCRPVELHRVIVYLKRWRERKQMDSSRTGLCGFPVTGIEELGNS